MKRSLTPCAELRESVCLLTCGLLEDDATRGLTAHLEACPGCKQYYQGIRSVSDELAEMEGRLAEVTPTPGAIARWRSDFERAVEPGITAPTFGQGVSGWCQDMIRPYRLVWGSLVAIWLVLSAMNVSFRIRSHTMASKSSRPSPEFVRAFLKGE